MSWSFRTATLFTLLFILNCRWSGVHAQGTVFTYQGRLNDGGAPANGVYDISASLYATNMGGAIIAGPVTNSAVTVSNGLFIIPIDYGAVFNGTLYWVEISVRTNGGGAFAALSPRQQLMPVPYAQFAMTASNLSGAFTGNAGGATNLQISNFAPGSGVLPEGALTYGVTNDNGSAYADIMINGRRYRVALTNTVAYSNLLSAIAASTNNLPFLKTMTVSGGSVSFSKNSDGSSNAAITVAASSPNIGWAQITNAPATNITVTAFGGINAVVGHAGVNQSGVQPGLNLTDPAADFSFMTLGIDTVSEGPEGWAGQLTLWGAPADNGPYYNVGGLHFANVNLYESGSSDARMYVLRVKDASVLSDGSRGAYILYEGRYDPSAPDRDTTYANYLLMDNNGNVGLGDLGERSDDHGNGDLHPSAKVTLYGSPNRNYPYLDIVRSYAATNTIIMEVDSSGVIHGNGAGVTNVNAGTLAGRVPAKNLQYYPYWVQQGTNSLQSTNYILISSNTLAHNGDQLWFNFHVMANAAGTASRAVVVQINGTNTYSQARNLAYTAGAPAWASFSGKLVRLGPTNCCVMDGMKNGDFGPAVGADEGGAFHDMNGSTFYMDTTKDNYFLVFQNANDTGFGLVAGSVFYLSSQ